MLWKEEEKSREWVMFRQKAYRDVSNELKHIKKVREKFEKQMDEFEEMKTAIIKMVNGITNTVGILEKNQQELGFHRKALVETMERIEALEKKNEATEDDMFA